jgi:hypothetical protein
MFGGVADGGVEEEDLAPGEVIDDQAAEDRFLSGSLVLAGWLVPVVVACQVGLGFEPLRIPLAGPSLPGGTRR